MAERKARSRDGLFKRGDSPYWHCWIRGVRRSTKCRDREAARQVKAQLERASVDPTYGASHAATVGGAVTDFLEHFQTRDRSDATASMYRQKCGHLVRVFGADRKLAAVTANVVDEFIARRLNEKASRSTVGKELTALRQVLKLAKRHGAFPADLAAVMPSGFEINAQPRRRALTWEELEKLIPEIAKFSREHAGMVVFFVATAARKSEAERAMGSDINRDEWTVKVRGTKTDAADDEVPIAEPFQALFERWVSTRKGLLFGVWANMTRDLAAACVRAGIDRLTANDLRRSNATLLRRAGVSTDVLARLLRHVDSRMVERHYGRIDAKAAGRLLASQLAAGPGTDHYQTKHSGRCDALPKAAETACVEGQNRTGDTRIFSPSHDHGIARQIAEFAAFPPEQLSPDSPTWAGDAARNSTGARLFRSLSAAWFRKAAA